MKPLPLTLLVLLAPLTAQDPTTQDPADEATADPIRLGTGDHVYEWVTGWAQLPPDGGLGNTHGCMVVDREGNLYVNTDTERAIVVFAPDGRFLRAFAEDFKGGLHGMTLVEEDGVEYLYLAHTGRHEVCKITLEGEVLWTLPYPETAGIYESANQYRPTAVAVGPGGEIFVADGYGRSWVHQFDAERSYVRSFGGPGTEPGKMRTPHGLWLDTRGDTPELIVCDRENHRLQRFNLEGELLGVVQGMLRRPCHAFQHGDALVVADLAGRVTLLDSENELIAHLGENTDPELWAKNNVPENKWRAGEFISPHSACWDAAGNLYVMDWVRAGRVTKLRRVEQ